MSIFRYTDNSLRVVVFGGSLWPADWGVFQNVLWVSPKCPPVRSRSVKNGDSETRFKSRLVSYLEKYSLEELNQWVDIVKDTDFSAVKVFLVTSTPGDHFPEQDACLRHQIHNILSHYCYLARAPGCQQRPSWELQASTSNIGFFGRSPNFWLKDLLTVLETTKSYSLKFVKFSIIYPTVINVSDGNGYGVKYDRSIHEKQAWVKKHLHQWKADKLKRSSSMTSGKTYCLIDPYNHRLAWFLLASANLSKNGWGYKKYPPVEDSEDSITCRSYESGVLFLPRLFQEQAFNVGYEKKIGERIFPILYDLPLTKYGRNDEPFCV